MPFKQISHLGGGKKTVDDLVERILDGRVRMEILEWREFAEKRLQAREAGWRQSVRGRRVDLGHKRPEIRRRRTQKVLAVPKSAVYLDDTDIEIDEIESFTESEKADKQCDRDEIENW